MALLFFAASAMLGLTACSRALPMTEESPAMTSYSVASGSERSENTQFVKISVFFDKPIKVGRAAKNDFRLTTDGASLDKKVMDYTVEAMAGNEKGLSVTLHATSGAQTPDKGDYFALHNGNLQIESAGTQMNDVTSADGKSSVRWNTIKCVVPSGLSLSTVISREGDAEKGVPASVTVKVDAVPALRVVTWLQLSKNGQPVMRKDFKTKEYTYTNDGSIPLHEHQFLQATPESCARDILAQLKSFFGETGDFTFSQSGDSVTIERTQAVNHEQLSFQIWTQAQNQ